MTKNGWKFDLTNIKKRNLDAKCGTENNWYGWSGGNKVGILSTVLKGAGSLTLDFGNCWDIGEVKVYLDSILMASAPKHTNSMIETFPFKEGSLLEIKDEGANSVIRLNSITFDYSGKIYFYSVQHDEWTFFLLVNSHLYALNYLFSKYQLQYVLQQLQPTNRQLLWNKLHSVI